MLDKKETLGSVLKLAVIICTEAIIVSGFGKVRKK